MSWAKWILIGFLALPVAEIVVFIGVAAEIGLLEALAIQAVCSLVGVAVIRSAGHVRLARLRGALADGMVGTAEASGLDLVTLVAGVLLVVPGFLTDALGALLLVPAVRARLRDGLRRAASQQAGGAQRRPLVDLEPDEWRQVPDGGSQEPGIRNQKSGSQSLLPPDA